MSLRLRLLGTIVGAIVLFFIFSVAAARLTLTRDLMEQGRTEVTNSSNAFSGYWDARKEQIRLLVSQDAVSDALRKNLESGNRQALQEQLSNMARASGLSFLTVVDNSGKVIARANNTEGGSLAQNSYVQRALSGETVSSAAIMPRNELTAEGLASQVDADVKNGNRVVSHVDKGLAIVSSAPMSDQNERTLGAIYGGILMNHFYDLVDQSSRALGGQTAVLENDAIVSSTISEPDGTRVIDSQIPAFAQVKGGAPRIAADSEGGTVYLARLDPITDDQNTVVGARWYGMPMSQITGILNHMTETFVLWGLLAMAIALVVAVPVVQRLSDAISKRSEQVSAAAKELGVAIVGGEVSWDHVASTKAAVERAGELINELSGDASPTMVELQAVNNELQGDMVVIDTLSQEMSNRLSQAVTRVAELNDVACGLDTLVHGGSTK
jgi:sensor histidine kinase regulating citrate/malate metabolism